MLERAELDFLRGLSVFAGLENEIVEGLCEQARRVEISADQMFFGEGEPAKEMLVVMRGRLEVVKRAAGGGEAVIAVLGPGDVVGEMSLIDIQPRSAAVRAVEASSVAVLTHGDIATLYKRDPKSYILLVLNIAREISLRLRRLDSLLANVMVQIREVTGSRLGTTSDPPGGKPS